MLLVPPFQVAYLVPAVAAAFLLQLINATYGDTKGKGVRDRGTWGVETEVG